MVSLACWVPVFALCPVANLTALQMGYVGPQVWTAIALQLLLLSIAQMGFGMVYFVDFLVVKTHNKSDRCHIFVYNGVCTKQAMSRSGEWPCTECFINRARTEPDNDSALISEHQVPCDGRICLLLHHDGLQYRRFPHCKMATYAAME